MHHCRVWQTGSCRQATTGLSMIQCIVMSDCKPAALQVPAVSQPAQLAAVSIGAEPQDAMQQMTQQLARSQAVATLPADSAAAPDQSELIASQAAELASARQAMQLMTQLLESTLSEQRTAADTAQPQPAASPDMPSRQVGAPAVADLQDLMASIMQQLAPSASQTAPDTLADHGQMLAAQAAELASARRAMQLLAQLLEQDVDTQAAPAQLRGHAADSMAQQLEAHGQRAEQSMQEALQQVLAALQPQQPASLVSPDAQALSSGQVRFLCSGLC